MDTRRSASRHFSAAVRKALDFIAEDAAQTLTQIAAPSGEEGLGDLRGVRHIFAARDDIDGFVSIDAGLVGAGSYRYKAVFRGPGGHSFGAFELPNSIHEFGRAIARIAELRVPVELKTTFNVGVVTGGTSVNLIISGKG